MSVPKPTVGDVLILTGVCVIVTLVILVGLFFALGLDKLSGGGTG